MGTIAKTDAQLVEASRRGEIEAFGHLVARYQEVVCAVGYSATGDRVLGEDVAQDTFVAAWQQLDRVRDVMRIGPWLCGIARNLGRKARRRTHREQLGEPAEQAALAPDAFEQLASRDAERVVREALGRVPDSYREVLVLYYREERSAAEVARTLGISEEAVMQRLTRGRRYLADSVTTLVERSLHDARPRRDLVAAVLAAIAVIVIAPRVDASPLPAQGSTMMKLALAATALAAAGTTVYLLHGHDAAAPPVAPAVASTASPLLHFGARPARAPSNGPTAKRHATAARRAAVDDLGWLPANADLVAGIDMSRIQSSALWKLFVAPALEHAAGIDQIVAACGFDPLASLSLVTIGISGMGNESTPSGTLVFHGFDKTKAMACMTTYGAPAAGATVTIDGDVAIIGKPGDPSAAIGLTFVDDSTALVVVGPAATTVAGIEQVAAGTGTLATSPQFDAPFGDIDSDDPLWLVIGPSSAMFTDVNSAIAPYTSIRVQAVYGSIDVSDSLVVQAGLRLGSPDQVTQLVGDIHDKVAQLTGSAGLAAYFDQLDITADGNDVIIDAASSTSQLLGLATATSANHAVDASATPAGSDTPGTFTIDVNL